MRHRGLPVEFHEFHHGCFYVVSSGVEEESFAYDANLFLAMMSKICSIWETNVGKEEQSRDTVIGISRTYLNHIPLFLIAIQVEVRKGLT